MGIPQQQVENKKEREVTNKKKMKERIYIEYTKCRGL